MLKAATDAAFFATLRKDEALATRFLKPEVERLLDHITTLADRVAAVTEAAAPILGMAAPTPTKPRAEETAPKGKTRDALLAYIKAEVAKGTLTFKNTPDIHAMLGGCVGTTALKAFKQLVAEGILTVDGIKRHATYTVNPKKLSKA